MNSAMWTVKNHSAQKLKKMKTDSNKYFKAKYDIIYPCLDELIISETSPSHATGKCPKLSGKL